jgi:hypothetical protein
LKRPDAARTASSEVNLVPAVAGVPGDPQLAAKLRRALDRDTLAGGGETEVVPAEPAVAVAMNRRLGVGSASSPPSPPAGGVPTLAKLTPPLRDT